MENLNQIPYTDKFTDFLVEFKRRSEGKKQWIDERLNVVDQAIQSIQNETQDPIKNLLNEPRHILKSNDYDSTQKVIFSIKALNDVFSRERIPNELVNRMSAFSRVMNTYIDIAKYTSDLSIAKEIETLGKTYLQQSLIK